MTISGYESSQHYPSFLQLCQKCSLLLKTPHRDKVTLDAHRFLFPTLREGYTIWKYYGTGQGLAALSCEYAFDYMDAPIKHVNSADVPMPYSKVLERAALPNKGDVIQP